jgi:hypothetical protein
MLTDGRGANKDYTEQEVLKAVEGSGGVITNVKRCLNCSWATARKYVDKYPSAVQAMKDERESLLDYSENNIIDVLKNDGNKDYDNHLVVQTSKWYLGILGKDRGFIEKQDLNIKHSGKIDIDETVLDEHIDKLLKLRENDKTRKD